jgi:histidyl-tRNA synthetase
LVYPTRQLLAALEEAALKNGPAICFSICPLDCHAKNTLQNRQTAALWTAHAHSIRLAWASLSLTMQNLPGFRDFYPDDCARRNYIFSVWREVARRYGFVEYDGPVLEQIELYEKKSGGELLGQLFDFSDKGGRHVALRPEMTPTLARMVVAREKDFRKPLKWFCCPQFFRYEKQQRGRLREFYQFNADIIGESSYAADVELICLAIDLFRAFGFTEKDFIVRICDRSMWVEFFLQNGGSDLRTIEFLQVIDKIEREDAASLETKLKVFGISLPQVREFMAKPHTGEDFKSTFRELERRGFGSFVELDTAIVRGLAYYTGIVFEIFDRNKRERALAGGGRYDDLLSIMSDGKVNLPALGFGLGDVVLSNLIHDTPDARARMEAWIAQKHAANIFVVIAKEEQRPKAEALVQRLRDAGRRVDFPLSAAKVRKQFEAAEHVGAELTIGVGDEWPRVKVKVLATREEYLVPHTELADWLRNRQNDV